MVVVGTGTVYNMVAVYEVTPGFLLHLWQFAKVSVTTLNEVSVV